MRKANLYELLGRPVATAASDRGTVVTDSRETYDDAGLLPSTSDCGTTLTTAAETYASDSVLSSVAELGTVFTRSNWETYDDDSLLPLM